MYSAKRRSAKRRNQRGLSLIESLVTMGIMSVGVLGLSASAIELSRTAKWADMSAAATALSSERLELIRSQPLGSALHAPGDYTAGTMQADGTADGPYTVSWVVSANDTPTWGLRSVTVTTSWNQYDNARQVQVGALIRCSKTPC
jgi:prepilin-type N-terminal cleavage/methylation domain-containing protein